MFHGICFEVKVLKTFRVSSDRHIKHANLSSGGRFQKLKEQESRTYALSVGFKIKPLRKSVFLC